LDQETLSELAKMICDKTSGNIFFTIQLLESLSSQNLIQFDKTANVWCWDIKEIKKQKITNNVVDLITKNLNKLPEACLNLLQIASAKGNSFNLDFLTGIEGKTGEEIESILESALSERIIFSKNRHVYHFIHDRVYSAVYETITDDKKPKLHLKIGLFLKENNENVNKDELFELTNHLNIAVAIIDDSEKNDLVHWNFISGRRAMKSVAYETANKYFSTAISLKGDSFWKENYDLCLDLHNRVLIPALYLGNYEWTETICAQIIENGYDKLDKTNAYLAQLNSLVAQGKYVETNELGLNILKDFGIKIPSNPNMMQVGALLIKAKAAFRGKEMKDILELPKMTDKEKVSVMQFLNPLITSSYLTSTNLSIVISLIGFIQTIKYGRSQKSAYYITSYGAVMSYLNKFDKGFEFGETAMELVKKRTPSQYYGREYVVALLFTIPFKKGLTTIYQDFNKIYENSIERGDLETAGWGLTNYYFYKYYSHGRLTELLEDHSNEIETFKQINNDFSKLRFKSLIQFADDLVHDYSGIENGEEEFTSARTENKYFSQEEIQILLDSKDLGNIGYYLTYGIHRNYLKRDYVEAIKLIEQIQPNIPGILGLYILSLYYLYSSLSILSAPKNVSDKHAGIVKKNQKKLLIWAKACPENFQHKYDLVNALIHQKDGKIAMAKDLYEKAIIGAKSNEFISEEAIAWELGAELFEESEINFQAEFYFQNAHRAYKDWGAIANYKRLEKKYPAYNLDSLGSSSHTTRNTSSSTSGLSFNRNMDLNSVIKASQSISREVKQEGLLKSLMLTIMENAGAENGLFIQNDSGKLRIEADCSITRNENVFLGGFDISKFNCPQGLLRYVLRTKKELVLNDALKDDTYRFDEYIQTNKIKSVLCFPVIHKNSVIAILYLENNQGTHAFTKDHLDTIRLLSSQVAISLENSSLYQSLEDKVADRTKKLNHAHKEIKDSIVYAKRIQTAILPQPSFLAEKFKNGFVLFKPKDVVSGDFFWFKEVDNVLLFAAADCTGHGVPGAMVSVICNAALNRSVREFGIVDPGVILDKTKELVVEVFETSEEKVQDGMDISICALNMETNELKWAGANNSLYCINKIDENTPDSALKTETHYLHEVKPNVQPIGIYEKNDPFKTHTIQMKKDSMIFLSTDGYADQFGGSKGKKLKTKNFKRLLLDNFHLEPEVQKNNLDNEFEKWRGDQEQLDDVCVVGLKF
ncbi:MAG: GAF domain-containing protein/FtsZ-binding cell division protein ZapB, partial [Arenicella sp.]